MIRAMKRLASFIVLCAFALGVSGQEIQMTTYYVAFLKKGPKWNEHTDAERAEIQKGHMAHIRKMADDKVLILAGPFTDNGDLRGMFIFLAGSMDEAKKIAENDPAVKSGRMVLEFHPWYSAKGIRYEGK